VKPPASLPSDPTLLVKVPYKTAAEVCQVVDLREPSLVLLRPGQTPRQLLDSLLAREHYPDAIRFLTGALPPREAIWWGCLCLRLAGGDPLLPALDTALRIAVCWVLDPCEIYREYARRGATGEEPHDHLLQAVTWTGGSLTDPPLPAVPPSPRMTPRAVSNALLLMAVQAPSEQVTERMRHFLVLGIGVARGKFPWPSTAPPRPRPPASQPAVPPRG